MSIAPSVLAKALEGTLRARYRTSSCFICGAEPVYYYGHGHATIPTWSDELQDVVMQKVEVVLGRCKTHHALGLSVPPELREPISPKECSLHGDGCVGYIDGRNKVEVGYKFIELFY
jgi:trehalose utilization protein